MRGAWGIKYWGKPHSMKKESYKAQEAKNGPHRMENQVIEINRAELCDEKKILLWSKWGGVHTDAVTSISWWSSSSADSCLCWRDLEILSITLEPHSFLAATIQLPVYVRNVTLQFWSTGAK